MASTKGASTNKRACTCCGKDYKEEDYYISHSKINKNYGRLPVCKNCIDEFFEDYMNLYGESRRAIFELCRLLDYPFYTSAYNGAETDKRSSSLHRLYIQKINSLKDSNSYGNCFSDGENIDHEFHIIRLDDENTEIDDETKMYLVHKWGKLPFGVIQYLENEYNDWVTRYECDSKGMEELIKQICFQLLDIKKGREAGVKVDAQLKTLQDLLGSANLKPVQETGANTGEQSTFGMLIKKWENEKPIPEPRDEFKDVDGIMKYINVWFLGHLCKMLGIENSYSKLYEEEIAKHTVSIDGISVEDEEMDE